MIPIHASRLAFVFAFACVAARSTYALAAPSPSTPTSPAPPPPDSPSDRAAKLREQGNEAMLGMRYSDGLAFYTQALALAPDSVGLHYNLARAHQFLGEYPEALTELEAFSKSATPEVAAKVGRLDDLFAQLRPRVSTLTLKCNVEGARVLLRDKVIGATPLTSLRVPAGAATLQIELDGYFVEAREVSLPGGGALETAVNLQRRSTSGLVSVRTEPMGAQVFIDGKLAGTSNPKIELTLPAGSHEVLARRDGYDVAKVPIVLQPGTTRDLSIPLEESVPVTKKWWFWTGLGAVVVGGIATAIALTTEKGAGRGSLAPGQVSVP